MKQNLILIGFMGSGKSSVGRQLSKVLDMKFIDTDNYIEKKVNMRVKDIFTLKGEEYFRHLEREFIQEIAKMNHTVIATGGGVISSKQNITLLKKNGFVVYLDCTLDCILERVSRRNTRPLLNNVKDLRGRVIELLEQRLNNYHKYMDASVFIDSDTNLWETVDRIKKLYIKSD
jgi:shikimate kinase